MAFPAFLASSLSKVSKPPAAQATIFQGKAFHVAAFANFGDESINSRNPFASDRIPYQSRTYGLAVSGPIVSRRSSYFVDLERQETDDNTLIHATTLDAELAPVTERRTLRVPRRRSSPSPI